MNPFWLSVLLLCRFMVITCLPPQLLLMFMLVSLSLSMYVSISVSVFCATAKLLVLGGCDAESQVLGGDCQSLSNSTRTYDPILVREGKRGREREKKKRERDHKRG